MAIDRAQPTTTDDVDEQFRSLLEGLRTTLPGVQVLFAFLLILPFESAFTELSASNRSVYYVAFTSSALASILLIAPSVHQRIRAPITGLPRRSRRHVAIANWLAIVGTIAFLVALAAAVFLVSDLVLNSTTAALVTAAAATIALWAWIYLPLVTFERKP